MKKFFKYLLAALFPCFYFLIQDNNKAAFITFILQLSIIGWLPSAIWACKDLKQKNASAQPKHEK